MNNLVKIIALVALIIYTSSCTNKVEDDSFSFAFLTDIHLTPDNNAVDGLRQALEKVDSIKADFIITGGDQIMDALGQSYERADSLYNLYIEETSGLDIDIYNTMGNHEIYGWYPESHADSLNPEYGKGMFRKRISDTYYTFEYKGLKFYILESFKKAGKRKYRGYIDSTQLAWIKQDLENVSSETPIIISSHIPFISSWTQIREGSTMPNHEGLIVVNSKEVLEAFAGHNLKLVLQGHLHILEDIYIRDIHFITAGAVSAAWWKGPYDQTEEGFLKINCSGNDFSWKYIDYG